MTDALVTCSEHFTELAFNEIHRHHPEIAYVQLISPQHFIVRNPGSFGHLTRPWKNKVPIYLHHVFPVHAAVPLSQTPADFVQLRLQADKLCRDRYIVQTVIPSIYPYSATTVNRSIRPDQNPNGDALAKSRIVSILIDGQTAYMGVSWAAQNISIYAGGDQPFDEPVPNRAGRKLLESLTAFNIHLRAGSQALDLGAAPGAWTEVLRRRGVQVTAVAPTTMYDWLQVDPNVKVFQTTAEDYLSRCNHIYDMLLNDMKLDAQDSARLMVEYARFLRPGGIALMTLKLRMRQPRRVIDHALRLLRKAYRINHVRQLVNNRKEVTLCLRRLDK